MPDLLFELFCEEIPARMQEKAAADLKKLVTDALVERGLIYENARAFSTPRRLALNIVGLPVKARDVREEKKGPRVGSPDAAVQGFLKSAGLASLDQAKIEKDPKKGEFYIAIIEKPGAATIDILAEVLPQIVRAFPWPKSMRWGAASAEAGSLRWVRPLHSIVATFGPETEDPEVVPFEIDGIRSGNVTYGHRFLAPDAIVVKRFEDYIRKLEAARVVLDPERRRAMIIEDGRNLSFARGLAMPDEPALTAEVSGLVEWPVPLLGSFSEEFLVLPGEVIRATIRNNQKCYVLNDAASGKVAPYFLATANIEASDGGETIIAGNARVIRARLSDARFFWETDQKLKLADRLDKLDNVTFHARLGSQGDRIRRIEQLARAIAPIVGADEEMVGLAARLAKADLPTEMVGEFPELQGFMGRRYAEIEGQPPAVSQAIEEHYKPIGPTDSVPTSPVSVAVALADKLDTLVGFWAIDEKPTGSKDPYALRRAALGVIRLVLENKARLPLLVAIGWQLQVLNDQFGKGRPVADVAPGASVEATFGSPETYLENVVGTVGRDLLSFFHDRLKVMLKEQGARHDLVDAVLSAGGEQADDLVLVTARVEALGAFLGSEDGRNLLAGYRRAANILRAEEKKDGAGAFEAVPDISGLTQPEEMALTSALAIAETAVAGAVAINAFEQAMTIIAGLRGPVDAFFDKILVNDPDATLRLNRLRILAQLRRVTATVADFSKVVG